MAPRARVLPLAFRPGASAEAAALARLLLAGGLLISWGCARSPRPLWQAATVPTVWPVPPDPPRIRYEGSIAGDGTLGVGTGRLPFLDLVLGRPRITLRTPHGLSIDAVGLAIADPGAGRVHLVRLRDHRYRALVQAGETFLLCPIGVVSDGAGGVFVSDSALRRVFHFTAAGALAGEVKGEFVRPTGLAFDPARRRLHVVDTGEHTVFTFQEGTDGFFLLRKLGQRGSSFGGFNFPTHATLDSEGNLYVTDSLNHRIQILDPTGRPVGCFGQAGDSTGDFAKAKGVAVDSEGHIYVVDSLYDVVQIFDRKGRCLLAFGGSGRSDGHLWLPSGICIDAEDRIYVADSDNSRIQVFQYLRRTP